MNDHPRPTRVLVVGSQPHSLGELICKEIGEAGHRVVRAGISAETFHLDVCDQRRCEEIVATIDPTHIVCTAGMNRGSPFYGNDWETIARDHMDVNYIGPMNLLAAFDKHLGGMPGTFVAISSNSAQVARSRSSAYCASKAALSMGLRCAARDATRAGKPLAIWGYEPGALEGTPMTRAAREFLARDVPMSRMLTSPAGMPAADVARIVARDLLDGARVLHGSVVRLDNGDQ